MQDLFSYGSKKKGGNEDRESGNWESGEKGTEI